MPPQPHPPVAEGAWLRPRPARQSPDCRRGRVHHHATLRVRRAQLKAAVFPAQHIRSALSQGVAGGAAHRRLRRIPAGRRVRMRRGLPSPGSVGIPPVAGSATSRLPPSAPPAVTASDSCRRPSSPLRSTMALGKERQERVPHLHMAFHECTRCGLHLRMSLHESVKKDYASHLRMPIHEDSWKEDSNICALHSVVASYEYCPIRNGSAKWMPRQSSA